MNLTEMNKLPIWKYSLLHRLKRGVSISISPTFRCNYHCDYCTLHIASVNPRKTKESTLDEWIRFIDNFPLKLKEVHITGGEPTLMPYLNALVVELINRKILVTVFTNLSRTITAPPSPFLRIQASYHRAQVYLPDFQKELSTLKKRGYQITVDEIGQASMKGTDVKPELKTVEDLNTVKPRIRIAPDRTGYFTTCYQMYL